MLFPVYPGPEIFFFFPLTRVTACTSVFVTRQCETWHGVMNGYVDRVSVPYSDLNLIGCPCNRGFVPLLMYLPHRPSETSRWHKGSRSWQCVLPRQFHTTAESISRKSQVWPWTRLRLDLFPFWMHHTQRRGGAKRFRTEARVHIRHRLCRSARNQFLKRTTFFSSPVLKIHGRICSA